MQLLRDVAEKSHGIDGTAAALVAEELPQHIVGQLGIVDGGALVEDLFCAARRGHDVVSIAAKEEGENAVFGLFPTRVSVRVENGLFEYLV